MCFQENLNAGIRAPNKISQEKWKNNGNDGMQKNKRKGRRRGREGITLADKIIKLSFHFIKGRANNLHFFIRCLQSHKMWIQLLLSDRIYIISLDKT